MTSKFYTSVSKGLKLKVRKFWELSSTFVEVTGKKLVGGGGKGFLPILNRVNWKKNLELIISAYIWSFMSFKLLGKCK